MVADMEVDMVGGMEVDTVANWVVDIAAKKIKIRQHGVGHGG